VATDHFEKSGGVATADPAKHIRTTIAKEERLMPAPMD
jgi:hypothetical protein